jgi:hypothetical protein
MTKSSQPGLHFPTNLATLPPSLPRHEPNWASGRGAGRVPARCLRRRPPQCLSRLSTARVVGAASSTQFAVDTPVRDQRACDATSRHPRHLQPGRPLPGRVRPRPVRCRSPLALSVPWARSRTPASALPQPPPPPTRNMDSDSCAAAFHPEVSPSFASPPPPRLPLHSGPNRTPGSRLEPCLPPPRSPGAPSWGPRLCSPPVPPGRRAHPPPRGHGPPPARLGSRGLLPTSPVRPGPLGTARRAVPPPPPPGRPRPAPTAPASGGSVLRSRSPAPPLPLLPGSGPRAAPRGRGRGAGCAAGAGRGPRGPPCRSCGREASGPAWRRDTHPGPAGVPHPTGGPRTFRGLRGRASRAICSGREGGSLAAAAAPPRTPVRGPDPPSPPAMFPGAKLKFFPSWGPVGPPCGLPSAGSARPARLPVGCLRGWPRGGSERPGGASWNRV